MLEYAEKGLIGLLTPQANTTAEPEFFVLMLAGYAFLNARLLSHKPSLEARLEDYFVGMGETVEQFANAPLGAYAFACTGASYLHGRVREGDAVKAIEDKHGRPFITAGRAVAEALHLIGAARIALVSPYPAALTEASTAYWASHGFNVASVARASNFDIGFHRIYSLRSDAARSAVEAVSCEMVDAIVMLGTGMPTLGPILTNAVSSSVPVLSSMSALAWRSLAVFDPALREPAAARRYLAGAGWRGRYDAFFANSS